MSPEHLPIHGILLLGGRGTRILNLTNLTNKHLLAVGGKRVVEYGIDFLLQSGICDVTMVVNPVDESVYLDLLKQNQWNVSANVVIQEQPLGTAHAISLCAPYVRHSHVAALWGDNLFEFVLRKSCEDFLERGDVCRIHITTVPNPQYFGVISLQEKKIIGIEDKPQQPKTNVICTGFMLFRNSVFRKIDNVLPNHKGEQDMMDVIRQYLRIGKLTHAYIKGHWFDIGTSRRVYHQACLFAEAYGFNKAP